jgi:hypothetical protein
MDCRDNVDLTMLMYGINLNIPTDGGMVEVGVGSPDGIITTLNSLLLRAVRWCLWGREHDEVKSINGITNRSFLVQRSRPIVKEYGIGIILRCCNSICRREKTATEADGLTLLLPGNPVDLIKAVAAVNPNTIVVMQTLGCVEVEEFKNLQNVPGIIWTGYNGQAQGDAIASILFGDANPGGKRMPQYKTVKALPDITDYTLRGGYGKNGRTYWYFDKEVS